MNTVDKLYLTKAWVNTGKGNTFECTFINAVYNYHYKHKKITHRQAATIDSIIEKNKIVHNSKD